MVFSDIDKILDPYVVPCAYPRNARTDRALHTRSKAVAGFRV